jgi:hypothetical protein
MGIKSTKVHLHGNDIFVVAFYNKVLFSSLCLCMHVVMLLKINGFLLNLVLNVLTNAYL